MTGFLFYKSYNNYMTSKEKQQQELEQLTAEAKKQLELTKELIRRAQENDATPFQFIHNLVEYSAAKKIYKAQDQLVKGFSRTAKKIKHDYAARILTDQSDLYMIITLKEIVRATKFYIAERDRIKDSMKEYHCYVLWGHIVNTLVGIDRPEEDEVDWRTIPINWNPFKK